MSLLLKCSAESMTSDAAFALEEFTCFDPSPNSKNLFRNTQSVNTCAMNVPEAMRKKEKVTLNEKVTYKQESLSIDFLDFHCKLCEIHFLKAH